MGCTITNANIPTNSNYLGIVEVVTPITSFSNELIKVNSFISMTINSGQKWQVQYSANLGGEIGGVSKFSPGTYSIVYRILILANFRIIVYLRAEIFETNANEVKMIF